MEKYNRLWRAFIAIGLIAIAIQQLVCGDLRSIILPPAYPAWLTHRLLWTWIFSIVLIAGCVCILFEIKARTVSLLMATVFLLLVLAFQISGLPYPGILGSWTAPFKELSISGGAFIIAGSFSEQNNAPDFIKQLGKLVPLGKYFFAVTLILFGYMHYVYPDFCASLVPNWLPWHYFWMYFAGSALIAGGLGIMINPTRYLAALLTGIMLFLWVIMLHIPRAIADPHSGDGNEWTSVFEAFAFSGIAFMLSGKTSKTGK